MDAILEVPIGVVIEELPLALETKAQLLCGKTAKQTPLSSSKELNVSLVFVDASYNEAMRWAQLTEVNGPS